MNLAKYNSSFSTKNKIGRLVWTISYWLLFRPFGLGLFRKWRIFLLNLFGGRISSRANIYASVKIWAPWKLEVGAYSCLGPYVNCYNQGSISIGSDCVISQKVYLCASGHDIKDEKFNLILRPIKIKDKVWVAADAFIGPGVTIDDGAVVAARAVVIKNVQLWTVVGGNPAEYIKNREITKHE